MKKKMLRTALTAFALGMILYVPGGVVRADATETDATEVTEEAEDASPSDAEIVPEVNNIMLRNTSMPEGIYVDENSFPDAVFRNYVLENFDTDKNYYLSDEERDNVVSIYGDSSLQSIKGIEFFGKLKELRIVTYVSGGTTQITEMDLTNNPELETLIIRSGTKLTSINLSQNSNLKCLDCSYTGIEALNLDNNTNLETLWCGNTPITSLKLGNNINLKDLRIDNTGITNLDLAANSNLRYLHCSNTGISELDLANNTKLETLYCLSTGITELNLDNNQDLSELNISNSKIKDINYSKLKSLRYLYCSNCGLEVLDL